MALRLRLVVIVALVVAGLAAIGTSLVVRFVGGTDVPPWWVLLGVLALFVADRIANSWWTVELELSQPAKEPRKPDPLARAATVLGELRTLVPLIEAELTAQERAVEKLEAQARQHEDDAQRNEARAKLYEQAAETVRDLVAETYAQETAALREQLRRMERQNRRDQVLFALGGAVIGAMTQVLF